MKTTWKFQALQLGHAFIWLWIACDESGGIEQKSVQHFPSYRAVVADATDHGFNFALDRWELLNPIDAPVADRGKGDRSA
jgi:hypothetical protein